MSNKVETRRCLVIGGTGMLGHKLVQVLSQRLQVWATIRRRFSDVDRFGIFNSSNTVEDVDALDFNILRTAIDTVKPDVVINAAGMIKQVANYEDPSEMIMLNAVLPHKLAKFSGEFGYRLISISTDCVFSGSTGNYVEEDRPDAIDIYGESKHLGEVTSGNCLTLRTSMIGRELDSSHSLVEWLLSNRGGEVKGFTRAIFSGFSTIALAEIILEIIVHQPALSGLYHVSSEPIAKFDLLKMIDRHFDAGIRIIPDDSLAIDRSLNSDRFWGETGLSRPTWPHMIEEMAGDPTPYDRLHGIG